MAFQKSRFGSVQTHILNFVVSGSKFSGLFSRTREESLWKYYLSTFLCLHPFRRYLRSILKMSEIALNFCMFLVSVFFQGGWASKFLHLPYKAQANYDHAAKFHGDRSTELRNLALKKNICPPCGLIRRMTK